jgi:hypothetical protein
MPTKKNLEIMKRRCIIVLVLVLVASSTGLLAQDRYNAIGLNLGMGSLKKQDLIFSPFAVSIHPFDDGNGRIARAIADTQLARADRTNQRFYSMSAQLMKSKKKGVL